MGIVILPIAIYHENTESIPIGLTATAAVIIGSVCVGFGLFSGIKALLEIPLDEKKVQQLKDEQFQYKVQFEKDIAKYKDQIALKKGEINSIQSKIQDCQRYLNLGKEKITIYWFAQRCAAFGVSQPVDPQIIAYRDAAFASVAKAEEEGMMVSLVCPACGSGITIKRDEALTAGQIICANCGSPIEIEHDTNEHTPDSTDTWICSACGWAYESTERPDCCSVCGASSDVQKRNGQVDTSAPAADDADIASSTGFSEK